MGHKNESLIKAEREAYEAKAKLKEELKYQRGSFGNKQHLGLFVAGAIAGAVMKSAPVRGLLVKSVAAGMKLEKEALQQFHTIKEEASDIVFDAQK